MSPSAREPVRPQLPRRIAFFVPVLGFCALSAQAHAQATSTGAFPVGVGPLQPVTASPSPPPTEAQMKTGEVNLHDLDYLVEKNARLVFPGPTETVTQDVGGFRTFLAEYGIGFQGIDTNTFEVNVLRNGYPEHPTLYDGQNPTYSGQHSWSITYDLGRLGDNGAQIIFQPAFSTVTRAADGPTRARIVGLSLYQPFLNGRIELKIGYGDELNQMVGFFGVGGNPLSQTAGPTGIIPVEAGMSHFPLAQPFVNLTLHGSDGWYNETGLSRSVSPLGSTAEADENGIGLRFGAPDSRAFVIDEVGVEHKAASDVKQLWVRGGGIYNFSAYTDFDGGRINKNYSLYLLADHQFVQIDPHAPARGFYVGGTAIWGTPSVNPFTQYYELRLYGIGLLKSRPRDIMSLSFDLDTISNETRHSFAMQGLSSASAQPTIGATYTFHVIHGLFLSPALAYSPHPNLAPDMKPALNFALSALVLY